MAITNKQRVDLIEAFIRENRYVDLHTLAERFQTSHSTVRRALNELEAQGVVRRHHGGASLIEDDSTGGYDFITQDDTNSAEKHRIADHVGSKVQDGMTIMLDGGTTTYAVAKILVRKRVIVVTNSLPIAALLNEVSSCETIVTGGSIYNRLGVLYGPNCEKMLSEMHADLAVMGCAGVTRDGIWNSNHMLSSFQYKMAEAADRAWFVADSSKLGRRALSLCGRFGPRVGVITTGKPDAELAAGIREANAPFEIC